MPKISSTQGELIKDLAEHTQEIFGEITQKDIDTIRVRRSGSTTILKNVQVSGISMSSIFVGDIVVVNNVGGVLTAMRLKSN